MENEWWYSAGGDRKGPITLSELRSIIVSGALNAKSLVWKKDMESWTPIAEVDELSDALKSLPPDLPQPTPRNQIIELPLAGPWRRFFARSIDLWFIALPTAFIVSYVAGATSIEFALWIQKPGSEYAFGWLLMPLVLLMEALIYGVFGTTLGKALLGVKVVTVSAYKASVGQYMKRLLGVYWSGLGTGFPLVSLFTMAHQYGRLKRGRNAGYDEGQFNVKATKLSIIRIFFTVAVIAALFSINLTLQVISQSSGRAYYTGFEWTNQVTGKTVSIPAGWIHESQKNEVGQPVDIFIGLRVGGFAVFAKEDMSPDLSLSEYARLWAAATEGTMALSVPGQPITINGQPALQITGTKVDNKSQRIDAVLVKNGRHMWRVVLLGTSGRNPASEDATQLRSILLNSID